MASVNKTKKQVISEMDQLQAGIADREYTGEALRESEERYREVVMANISSLTVESPTQSYEHRVIVSDGEVHWQHWTNLAMFDTHGKVIAYQSIGKDITDRKQAEKEMQKSEERYRAFAHKNPYGIQEIDLFGTILYANKAHHEMYGYEEGKLIGHSISDFFALDSQRDELKGYLAMLAKEQPQPTPYFQKILTAQGNERDIEVVWNYLKDTEGRVRGFLSVLTDITERKQAEAEREELLKTVSAKNAELQSIVYIASHDLKSPLVNIEGFGGELSKSCDKLQTLLLNAEPDADEKTKIQNLLKEDIPESLKFITAGTNKIKMLLDGLLQVSRVGTAMINIQPIDMNKVLDDICDAMEFQFSDTNTNVVIDDLPGCLGDMVLTNQVFSNLIDNAIKYINPNRPGKIHISGWTDSSMTTYCIEDNGMGIDQGHIEKIFEIFHRLAPDDSAGGEGLGLSIVMRILDRLNGHIRVESQLGKGSKFFVSLPIVKS